MISSYVVTNAWHQIDPFWEATQLKLQTLIHNTVDLAYYFILLTLLESNFPVDGFDIYWVLLEGIQFCT